MAKKSKAFKDAAALIEEGRHYAPLDAVRIVKKSGSKKTDSTVEVAMRLSVDPRKADQMVRGTVNLPHGTGKTARVIVLAPTGVTVREIATVDNPGPARELLLGVTAELPSHAEELRALDAALGDGDLGITVSSGARAVHEALTALPENAAVHEVLRTAGTAFASANPSTFAALLGGGTLAAATAVAKNDEKGDTPVVGLSALITRIAERGGAEIGDKTVLDVLDAVLHSFEDSAEQTLQERVDKAVNVARDVVEKSASLPSRRGRAAWVGERSIGHKDPGQVAALRFLEALAATVHAN